MTTIEQLFGVAQVVDDVVTTPVALDPARFTRYARIDNGSYDVQHDVPVPAEAVQLARELTGRALRVAESRALRLHPGDYLLAHHDRIHDDNPVELVIDLSPAPVPGAQVHYRRRGNVFLRVPCKPGSVAVVERGPTVTCNHTYVSKLHARALVVRIVALLR